MNRISQAVSGRAVIGTRFRSERQEFLFALPKMSEERSKISLRSGKKRRPSRPVISAPKQISGPMPQDNSVGGTAAQAAVTEAVPRPRLRPPPMAGGKVSLSQSLGLSLPLSRAAGASY